jgi:hypothetical protein
MTDEEMRNLCAEAMGWKHLGAVGIQLPDGMRGSEADRLYPGKLWCLSGANDWWKHPEGSHICGRCESIPNPLEDDAQAMALVKRFGLLIEGNGAYQPSEWTVQCWNNDSITWDGVTDSSLNRAIVKCVSALQLRTALNRTTSE